MGFSVFSTRRIGLPLENAFLGGRAAAVPRVLHTAICPFKKIGQLSLAFGLWI
jgi:hypothetical protein